MRETKDHFDSSYDIRTTFKLSLLTSSGLEQLKLSKSVEVIFMRYSSHLPWELCLGHWIIIDAVPNDLSGLPKFVTCQSV